MFTQIFTKQLFSERVKYDQPLPSVELCGKDSFTEIDFAIQLKRVNFVE